jgi:hypothetical protein
MDQLQEIYDALHEVKKSLRSLFMRTDWEDLGAENFLRRAWRGIDEVQRDIENLVKIRQDIEDGGK